MSGNSLYLICEPCSKANTKDFGFKLAERGIIGAYEVFGPAKATSNFSNWLKNHRHCAGKTHPDHFKLGHLNQPNADQPKRPILTLKQGDKADTVSQEIQ